MHAAEKSAPVGRSMIGVHLTPPAWVEWLITRMNVLDAWLSGAAVLDPTCGDGRFLLSLIRGGVARGIAPDRLPLGRLFGIEREGRFRNMFLRRVEEEFGVDFPGHNFVTADLFFSRHHPSADILVGNPPWRNFVDLPGRYKERLKPLFAEYGLISTKRSLLLGGSRIDIAALVLAKAIRDHLRPGGRAYFFLPLSLFFNEGAHEGFRRFDTGGVGYALEALYDFRSNRVFPGISTRYGIGCFRRDARTEYPVPCRCLMKGIWVQHWASPADGEGSALTVSPRREPHAGMRRIRIPLDAGSKPRQGVNTCGAAGTLIFSGYRRIDRRLARVSCEDFGEVRLPSRFLYPVIDREHFGQGRPAPRRHILLPYEERSGKPLTPDQVKNDRDLSAFFSQAADTLKGRKGTLIGRWIRRGEWWASLGVGRYCFTPFKLVWRSYGTSQLLPKIFGAHQGKAWQANQALHAYIPCRSLAQARALRARLMKDDVRRFLDSFRMSGTRSWAQPGKMAILFDLRPPAPPERGKRRSVTVR